MAESVPDLVQRRSSFRPDALADAERGTDGEGRSFRGDLPLLRRVQLAPPLSLFLSGYGLFSSLKKYKRLKRRREGTAHLRVSYLN